MVSKPDHRRQRSITTRELTEFKANVSDSDNAGGSRNGSVLRIERGSDCSTSCSRSVNPRAASIFSRSSACGPMCRLLNRCDGSARVAGVWKGGGHRFLFCACRGQVLSHSPSVTRGFRVAMTYAVLLPERFRGCCTFGATNLNRRR